MEFKSFNKLIQSIQSHVERNPGVVILLADDPFNRLIGFRSNCSDEHWTVNLANLKRWLIGKDVAYPPGRLAEENTTLFKSTEGRQELARRLAAREPPFTLEP